MLNTCAKNIIFFQKQDTKEYKLSEKIESTGSLFIDLLDIRVE